MKDPVMVEGSGLNYELDAITEWIRKHGNDPRTGDKLKEADLIPNRTLKLVIDQWRKDQMARK